jgi:hypothetical protein
MGWQIQRLGLRRGSLLLQLEAEKQHNEKRFFDIGEVKILPK